MNRENNKYINDVGEVLNANEFLEFVKSEAKRQYEECTESKFDDMTADEQQECILQQYEHQLNDNGWKVENNGISIRHKVKDTISYVFGKYDMRRGKDNELRMKHLLEFCMSDIESHPSLEDSLKTKEALEFFVTQSIIYMMH